MKLAVLALCLSAASAFVAAPAGRAPTKIAAAPAAGIGGDLTGKVAFVAGVADSTGYGWAIAKALAEAGATIIVGTWPPVLNIFKLSLDKGKLDEDRKLSNGGMMDIAKVYPLDAVFDDPEDVPEDVKSNKRYAGLDGYSISEVATKIGADYGKIDILVHSLANGPEVTKPLLETSRRGYLAASSASAYSMVSLVQKFGPVMKVGGSVLSLTYIAAEKVIPGYGGGMSSAKSALESDTKVLAYEAGQRFGIRVNTISAGPLKSRAATAISGSKNGPKPFIEVAIDYCKANAPLNKDLTSDEVGATAAFMVSDMGERLRPMRSLTPSALIHTGAYPHWCPPACALTGARARFLGMTAAAVTGVTMYVDNGMHAMGMVQAKSVDQVR